MGIGKYIFVSLVFFLMLSCGDSSVEKRDSEQASGSPNLSVEEMLSEARQTLKIAQDKGFEWTGTRDLLEQAEEALAGGEQDRAAGLAKAALQQATAAVQQAKYAEGHWQQEAPR